MRHAAILVVLTLAGCTHSKSDAMPPRPQTPKEVIASARATVEQWRQAYQVRSLEALSKLYAHDTELVVVQDGQQLVGWASVEPAIKDVIDRHQNILIRLKDINVTGLSPTSAVATAGMTRELGDETTTVTEGGALMLVLRRDGETWVIAAEHYSHKKGGM